MRRQTKPCAGRHRYSRGSLPHGPCRYWTHCHPLPAGRGLPALLLWTGCAHTLSGRDVPTHFAVRCPRDAGGPLSLTTDCARPGRLQHSARGTRASRSPPLAGTRPQTLPSAARGTRDAGGPLSFTTDCARPGRLQHSARRTRASRSPPLDGMRSHTLPSAARGTRAFRSPPLAGTRPQTLPSAARGTRAVRSPSQRTVPVPGASSTPPAIRGGEGVVGGRGVRYP